MSDSLTNYVLSYSAGDQNGPWTTIATLDPSETTADDSHPPNPVLWYQLSQITANGQSVPFNVVSLSNLPMGHVDVVPDPNDPWTLIFTWTTPSPLPGAIGYFELYGKYQNDPESEFTRIAGYGPDERTARVTAVPTDDLSNPYTYQLILFIPR